MSVERARELLGDDAKDMSDDEIIRLVADMEVIAQYALELAKEKLAQEYLEKVHIRHWLCCMYYLYAAGLAGLSSKSLKS